MKNKLFIFLLILPAILHGQSSKDLLRDGLFAEESEGDLKVATKSYETLLKSFEAERKVAAVALYRLAAVKRKQGEEKAALALYEEFGKKFGDVEPQATLVRENYLAISGSEFPGGAIGYSEEDKELARIQKLEVTSPDLFPNFHTFKDYVSNGQSKIVAYLLKKGTNPNFQGAIEIATSNGNLAMVRQLLEAGADPNHQNNKKAFSSAIAQGHWQIAELLGQAKADLKVSWPSILTSSDIMKLPPKRIDFLINHGADPNYVSESTDPNDMSAGIPLQNAIELAEHDFVKLLLKAGAKVDFSRPTDGVQALHYASALGDEEMVKILIEAGADPNAVIQVSKPSHNRYPKRYSKLDIKEGKRPIDLIPINKARVLLEAGATFSPEVVVRAAGAKNTDLIDYLISKGADLNEKNSTGGSAYQLPLNRAFLKNDENMAKHLFSKGAKLSLADHSLLPPKYRIKAARNHYYEKLAKMEKIHVVFPEIPSIDEATFSADFDPQVYANLMKIKLPDSIRSNSNNYILNYNKLTYNLVRSGKIEPFNFKNKEILELQSGDVIEIIGFGKFMDFQHFQGSRSLERIFCPLSKAVRKAARFPIQISHAGITHDMTICPDKLTFDARSNEMPNGNLGQILHLLFNDMPVSVSIERAGFPKFNFQSVKNGLNGFELKAGDHIHVFPQSTDTPSMNSDKSLQPLKNVYRKNYVSARTKDKLGIWRWAIQEIYEGTNMAPTLLALIADINNTELQSGEGIEEMAFKKLSYNYFTKILPGIDLNKIVIHRLEGEIDKEIVINLAEKIEKWGADQKKDKPFDFQLQSGDIVEFTTHEGRWKGFTKMTNLYFEAALNMPLINDRLGSVANTFDLQFKMPGWYPLNGSDIPVIEQGTRSSIRGNHFLPNNSSVKVQRDAKELIRPMSSSTYWPKAGDVFQAQNTRSGAQRGISRTSSSSLEWPPNEKNSE